MMFQKYILTIKYIIIFDCIVNYITCFDFLHIQIIHDYVYIFIENY